MNDPIATATDPNELLAQLTLDEKIALLSGSDTWRTAPVARLGVPAIKVSDGPNGVRGDSTTGASAVCLPASIALGASFDRSLVRELGELLGRETARKGAHVLLAPTINIARHPLGGRNFESFGEDPLLTSAMAVAYVDGVQSEPGVGACAKHFVANDVEYRRMTVSSEVDERTLREVYLTPFEAVTDAGVWSLMASYPKLNGTHCTEHSWLLTDLLRDEWGWDGLVMSDWGATHHPSRSVLAGLDLEMPGPPRALGAATRAAIDAGELTERDLDAPVLRVLALAERAGRMHRMDEQPEQSVDDAGERSLVRRAAAAGTVLLRNAPVPNGDSHINSDGDSESDGDSHSDGALALPLDPALVQRVAVIGPNADPGVLQGGGSAQLPSHDPVSPLEGLEELFAEVTHHPGCLAHRYLPLIPAESWVHDDGQKPVRVQAFADAELGGDPISDRRSSRLGGMADPRLADAPEPSVWSKRLCATIDIEAPGVHQFSLFAVGRSRLLIDGALVVDNWSEPQPGDGFFQMASTEVVGSIDLEPGPAELTIEWSPDTNNLLVGLRVGWLPPVDEDAMLDDAVAAASSADAAVLVVGLNADWETESHDRPLFGLPGRQLELIERVAAANPRSIVVLNAGGPVDLPWLDDVPATLMAWYPGQEFGSALADVLSGTSDPGGRLPVTFPHALADAPTEGFVPGEGDLLHYGEGTLVGHRWYDRHDIEPRLPFGAGLSYATFDLGKPVLRTSAAAGPVEVGVAVTNTSDRTGTCVLQLYVEPPPSEVDRPIRLLSDFASMELGPGEHGEFVLTLDPTVLRVWTDDGWTTPGGAHHLVVGTSSRDHVGRLTIDLPSA